MQRISAIILSAALAASATAAHAAGNPAAGKAKSQTCTACHGERGLSPTGIYPRLAGQHESYLFHALKAYKTGERQNPIMAGMVSGLSEQDMHDLAAYYASQPSALFTLSIYGPD